MGTQTPLESEIAELVVTTLNLEDVSPGEIVPDDNLFDGELALDSVDALEIALSLSQRYGVQLKAEDDNTRAAFQSIRSLSEFVAANRTT